MFGDKGGTTVRITFVVDGKEEVMLFGNSYKKWYDQAAEFIYRNYGDREHGWRYKDLSSIKIKLIERSLSSWKGWGGLKWCDEGSFQEELNREGVQSNEPDNPNPRQYKDFHFSEYPYGYRVLQKELKRY